MIVLTAIVMMVVAFWIFAAIVGAILRLAFGLIGGVFTLIGGILGLFIGGIALLVVGPLVALALFPVLAPALVIGVVVWLIVRATRRPRVEVAPEQHSIR